MTEENNVQAHTVLVGDEYVDNDTGRQPRTLRVLEVKDDVAKVVNVQTRRITRIRVDRLSPNAQGTHGYSLSARMAVAHASGEPDRQVKVHLPVPVSGPAPFDVGGTVTFEDEREGHA